MMDNNDILRRLRYTFDFSEGEMAAIYSHTGTTIPRDTVTAWLRREEDLGFVACPDVELARFLDGFIIDRRGRKDGPLPVPEKKLSNNIIFRKLKIALNLQAEGVLNILGRAGMTLGKSELSAFFRRPGTRQYRQCKDQVLRNFLKGLQLKHRPAVKLRLDKETPWSPSQK